MAHKLVLFATIVAMAHAGVIAPYGAAPYGAAHLGLAGPLGYGPAVAKVAVAPAVAKVAVADDYDPNPQYNYAYNIQDALTGDSKSQQESRSGDVVQGQYSLVEPDGTRRIVDYTADPVNGFNAVVSREPAVVKAAVAKIAAPVAYGPAGAYHGGLGYAGYGKAIYG